MVSNIYIYIVVGKRETLSSINIIFFPLHETTKLDSYIVIIEESMEITKHYL